MDSLIRPRYFIHGNGMGKSCAPQGFQADSIPGHDDFFWPTEKYSLNNLIDFFADIIPQNSIVLGHSLGGHIALNVALARPDISVVVCGMAPLNGLADIGTLMTPVAEFAAFQNPERTIKDIEDFSRLSALDNDLVLTEIVSVAQKQDPNFNLSLFTHGIQDYDWNEIVKAKSLGHRFLLLLTPNERVYNFDLAKELDLNSMILDYDGHAPWLQDHAWFESIEDSVLAKISNANNELRFDLIHL